MNTGNGKNAKSKGSKKLCKTGSKGQKQKKELHLYKNLRVFITSWKGWC